MTKQKQSDFSINIKTDKKVIAQEIPSTRIIEVAVVPPTKENGRERLPLNLSLVLDHSGSMRGEKMEYVKQAACHVLELLEEMDKVSVVVYDDIVDTIVPLNQITDSFRADAKKESNRFERVAARTSQAVG